MPSPKFKPGESGNLKGRPPNKTATVLLRTAINEAMPEIIQGLIDQAKKGDVAAAKILIDKICPSLKPEAMAISYL